MQTIQIENKSFFIPDQNSPCELWKSYLRQLRKEVGRENAKLLWLVTWGQNGSMACTLNPAFNSWLKKNEIDVSNAASRTVADLSQIGHNVLGLGKRMTGVLSIGAPLLFGSVLVAIIFILINTARNANAVDVAAMAAPQSKLALLTQGLKK